MEQGPHRHMLAHGLFTFEGVGGGGEQAVYGGRPLRGQGAAQGLGDVGHPALVLQGGEAVAGLTHKTVEGER